MKTLQRNLKGEISRGTISIAKLLSSAGEDGFEQSNESLLRGKAY